MHEAIALPLGTADNPIFHRWRQIGDYEIGFRKPGKEANLPPPRTNLNDMLPTIRGGGEIIEYAPGFSTIYAELEHIGKQTNTLALELIACLFYRAAFMLDHREFEPDCWRYEPSERILDEIESWVPVMGDVPSRVFLHLVEAISVNEDVKYFTLGKDIRSGTGRTNNLSTCTHICAYLLGRVSLVELLGAFARQPPGVAPLTQRHARTIFPLLGGL